MVLILLDQIVPKPGGTVADYDLVIASQPYRARASLEFKAKRAELESQLAALGFAAPKKRGRPRKNAMGGSVSRKRTRRTAKVKAKYRDPKSNETWSGRGRMASWLKSKQDAGEKMEKYLV